MSGPGPAVPPVLPVPPVPAVLAGLTDLVAGVLAQEVRAEHLGRVPPPQGGRASAVLMLFGVDDVDGADVTVLLITRAATLRSHAGQVAFPGGACDPDDDGVVATALREAAEETGLDPRGVQVLGTLPDLYIPPSGFVVTPVVAWWRTPSPVGAADPAEVAAVHRVRVADLAEPAHRMRVRHSSGYAGPAFQVDGLLVWGFTAMVLDRVIRLAGWERAWGSGVDEPGPADLDVEDLL